MDDVISAEELGALRDDQPSARWILGNWESGAAFKAEKGMWE